MKKVLIIINLILFITCCGFGALHYFYKEKSIATDYQKTQTVASNLPSSRPLKRKWAQGLMSKGDYVFDRGRAAFEGDSGGGSVAIPVTETTGSSLPFKIVSVIGKGSNGKIFIAPRDKSGFKSISKDGQAMKRVFAVGEEIAAGYVLKEIIENGAVLSKNSKQVTLEVEKTFSGGSVNKGTTIKDRLIIGPSSE